MEETTTKAGDFFLAKASRVGGPVTCVAFSPSKAPTGKGGQQQSKFFFVAQGPYLTRYNDNDNNLSGGNNCNDNNDQANQPQQLLVLPDDKARPRGGGTIHGISFLNDEKHGCAQWDAVVYGGKRLAFCNLMGIKVGRWDTFQSSTESVPNPMSSSAPFLELDDWVWNVKIFPKQSYGDDNNKTPGTSKSKISLVVGFARHMIEIWNVEKSATGNTDDAILSTRLRRFFLNPATVVTSMDFIFLNREYQSKGTDKTRDDNERIDTLWIAAGTSFHKIWISCISIEDILEKGEKEDNSANLSVENVDSANYRSLGSHLLQGHSGVVHSVRWFQDGVNISLASTSDDRSVRRWVWDEADGQWMEKWTGWGHSARVWNISTIYASNGLSASSPSSTAFMLISVAEDGTARVWSAESGETLACIHHPTSLWTVDTRKTDDDGNFIIGAVDGISAIYNVHDYVTGRDGLKIDCVAVPDDRPPLMSGKSNCLIKSIAPGKEKNEDANIVPKKKKKKTKNKIQSQVIVGMKCWKDSSSESTPKILVATRQGSLFTFDIHHENWQTCDPWWQPSIGESYGIQANDGNCLAVLDRLSAVAIGTARGDIIIASTRQEKIKSHTILHASKLRAVQGLTFYNSSCLISFHVRTVAFWKVKFDDIFTTSDMQPDCVLQVETKGIPQCCAYDQENERIIIGDSRGNLSYYQIINDEFNGGGQNHWNPICVLTRVHQKQHITSIKWLNKNTILSAGNDGCLHVSYLDGDILQRGWSYSAPSLTGITKIITDKSSIGEESYSGPIVVAGYHGNIYRVMDMDSGYEYIRCDTGGRQRILDCRFIIDECNIAGRSLDYQLLVCQAQKDGSNVIYVQNSFPQFVPKLLDNPKKLTAGVKLHGETIFESTFFNLASKDLIFLVTASEDCSSRISSWKGGEIVDSVQLTPQESCCRCVAVSQIDKKSVLLIVGGGKLALQFFLVKERRNCSDAKSTRDLQITFIGNGLTSKKGASIDHRINSICALPLSDDDSRFHLVLAGDSEGCSHAFLVSEDNNQHNRSPRGLLVPTTSERPILCIKMLVVCKRILILMGTTGGEIDLFDLPASLPQLQESWEDFQSLWSPIGRYQGHQMGTNTISVQVLSSVNSTTRAILSIVSGGDDQALCVSRISVQQTGEINPCLQLVQEPNLKIIPEASFSAIKGVSHVRFHHQRYLLSVGYSQQLSVWKIDDDDDMILECTSKLPVDLGDVNCIAVHQSFDESSYLVAVCGMGVEVFRKVMSI